MDSSNTEHLPYKVTGKLTPKTVNQKTTTTMAMAKLLDYSATFPSTMWQPSINPWRRTASCSSTCRTSSTSSSAPCSGSPTSPSTNDYFPSSSTPIWNTTNWTETLFTTFRTSTSRASTRRPTCPTPSPSSCFRISSTGSRPRPSGSPSWWCTTVFIQYFLRKTIKEVLKMTTNGEILVWRLWSCWPNNLFFYSENLQFIPSFFKGEKNKQNLKQTKVKRWSKMSFTDKISKWVFVVNIKFCCNILKNLTKVKNSLISSLNFEKHNKWAEFFVVKITFWVLLIWYILN